MITRTRPTRFAALILALLAVWLLAPAAAPACDKWARITSLQGEVLVKHPDQPGWQPAQMDEILCPGDRMRTEAAGRAALLFYNESTLRLGAHSALSLPEDQESRSLLLRLKAGIGHFFSRRPRSVEIRAAYMTGAVEGTEFTVEATPALCRITVLDGRVRAANPYGELLLSPGQAAEAAPGGAPVLKLIADPRDAVRWTLYYPPVADPSPDALSGPARDAALAWRSGELNTALARIETIPARERNREITLLHAQVLLLLGQVARAEALLNTASDPVATALRAVIAVVQNRKADALELADAAVAAAPESAAAHMARSYARQAAFDLDGALESAQQAAAARPGDALILARISELHLSFGRVDAALAAADQAIAVNPALSRTQTVLGFARLNNIEIDAAKNAFREAIHLDSADPLPRLGLGLAVIRKGDLAAGREQIEIAAGLDPDNALIRAYLGKAFHDEKRDRLAEKQYAAAKKLDPEDPTPWYYDALRKQSVNRPVEALQDLQESIRLNDNRAVYRSSLLLDQDLSARSASLARIYTDLGFGRLALAEGWKSLASDPANHSAYRFLADAYSTLPRHETARASALLVSQLLQPLNVNPIQPHLAASNLGILDGSGPSDISFNEYNPLFTRNRMALQANGVVGGKETMGDDLVVSALYDRVSASVGQYYYQTDGFRENNDQQHQIYNGFIQAALGSRTSLQAEYRYRSTRTGDLSLLFDRENYVDIQRGSQINRTFRVGGRHHLAQGSELLFDFSHLKDHYFNTISGLVDLDTKRDSAEAQALHLYQSSQFQVSTGGFYAHSKVKTTDTFNLPSLPFPMKQISYEKREGYNVYGYCQITVPEQITWTVGASLDRLTGAYGDTLHTTQFNPKFGLLWRITPKTLFRAAAFRTLRNITSDSQLLEPVQVAGFTQFFGLDSRGTDSWRYGGAIEHTFSPAWHAGFEASYKEMDIPIIKAGIPPSVHYFDWADSQARAYAYWTPHPWVSLSFEYGYERLDRSLEAQGPEQIDNLTTHRARLGLGFFHPCGFMARITPTYVDQSGDFVIFTGGSAHIRTAIPDSDRFVTVDAEIGYRLPNRCGMITLEAKNLFDESFNYQDTDPDQPSFAPEQLLLLKFSVSL